MARARLPPSASGSPSPPPLRGRAEAPAIATRPPPSPPAASRLPAPALLLLGEPPVGVDPELRAAFWTFFRELTGRGKTVVITTHYMEEAAKCDLVGLLHQGRLLARGPPRAAQGRSG